MSETLPSNDGVEFEDIGRAVIGGTKSYRLRAKHIDQTFIIDVARPAALVETGRRLPVVYVLDGNGSFGLTAQTAHLLQLGVGALPPMIVVGIGYHTDRKANGHTPLMLRFRDFTPSVDDAYLALARATPAPMGLPADLSLGGAATFLKFINEELNPFIAARYPIDPNDQTLVGMSLGGLFTLYTLFNAPGAFQRYLALSPSIWWDERMLLREEAAYAAKSADLPARLFLSIGDLEEAKSDTARMISNAREMEATLRARRYPNLQMTLQIFPDETHMSVFPAAVSRGLRTVFA